MYQSNNDHFRLGELVEQFSRHCALREVDGFDDVQEAGHVINQSLSTQNHVHQGFVLLKRDSLRDEESNHSTRCMERSTTDLSEDGWIPRQHVDRVVAVHGENCVLILARVAKTLQVGMDHMN